jgi:hypothetical protein
MTALQIIAMRAPQWASDPRLSSTPSLIDYATQLTGSVFGDQRDMAIALRVLHILATESLRGGNPGSSVSTSGEGHAGAVTSESEGQLSKSFTVNSTSAKRWANLSTTSYGLELIELLRGCGVFPRTRAMDSSGTTELVLPGFFSNMG